MKCPACANQLQPVTIENVTVDVCKDGCGGVWFDNFEIKKFDEPHESAGNILEQLQTRSDTAIEPDKRYKCPKCDDVVMMRHFFSVKKQITVDECPGCAGYFLDAGELKQIRSLFKTEAEKDQAAKEYFSELFDNQLAAMKAQGTEELKKAQKIAGMFRFICPTNYIPGKQDWGAF